MNTKNEQKCPKCLSLYLQFEFKLGPFIAVDIENQNVFDFVHKAPKTINLDDSVYLLFSVIGVDVIKFKTKKEEAYTTFCRTPLDNWHERNGKKIIYSNNMPKRKVCLMLYVKSQI